MVELAIHSKAFNVARRLTAQNDFDIMHSCVEETVDDTMSTTPPRKFDYLSCAELASHLTKTKQVPPECSKFTDIVSSIRRRETDSTNGTEILS
ncbi:hypothetical protein MHU86_9533 [Fragilaria crotonensis]|nr:hypothetical protein MHU86_9533 [Fragilaria crotonensis]